MSVIKVESNFKQEAIGEVGEIGLMQIRPEYTKVSPSLLKTRYMNLKVGMKKLSEAKRLCAHQDDHTYLVCYNAGVTGGSRIKYPKQFPYYKKVMEQYKVLKGESWD